MLLAIGFIWPRHSKKLKKPPRPIEQKAPGSMTALRVITWTWNGLALLAAGLIFLVSVASMGDVAEIFKTFELGPASPTELLVGSLMASLIGWAILMVVWSIGALVLLIARNLTRRTIARPPSIRVDPRL